MAVAYCMDCGDRIYLGRRPWVGQAVFCHRCGADLEVTRVNPLELDWTDNLVDEYQQEEAGFEPQLVPSQPPRW
jgi:lysine biosynthesis protein LysW